MYLLNYGGAGVYEQNFESPCPFQAVERNNILTMSSSESTSGNKDNMAFFIQGLSVPDLP